MDLTDYQRCVCYYRNPFNCRLNKGIYHIIEKKKHFGLRDIAIHFYQISVDYVFIYKFTQNERKHF